MRKSFLTVMFLIVAVFFAYAQSEPGTPGMEDPTGTMDQIRALNAAHDQKIQAILDGVPMDFHPEYGTVMPGDFPVSPNPLTIDQARVQVENELIADGFSIVESTANENTLSGPALSEHLINNQQVFVWHHYDHVPIYVIRIIVMKNGKCYIVVRVWIQTCTNGAGYWAWLYIEIPCFPFPYTFDYYSTNARLAPYPIDVMPMAPPSIDFSGTLQQIHELNVAHRLQINDLINNVPLDQHPTFGHIPPQDYPVNPAGMNLGDAYDWIYQQTIGMDLIDVLVEERTFSGRALSEHMVGGSQIYVWHEFDNVPIAYAEALYHNPNDGYCYKLIRVWVWDCENHEIGHWEYYLVRVPCDHMHISIDYAQANMGLVPSAY